MIAQHRPPTEVKPDLTVLFFQYLPRHDIVAGQDGDPITVRNFHLTLANSFWFAVGTLMQQGMLCCQALYVPPENMRVGLCACFCFVYSASHCRDSGKSLSIVCSVVE
mgnify:FL=1